MTFETEARDRRDDLANHEESGLTPERVNEDGADDRADPLDINQCDFTV